MKEGFTLFKPTYICKYGEPNAYLDIPNEQIHFYTYYLMSHAVSLSQELSYENQGKS